MSTQKYEISIWRDKYNKSTKRYEEEKIAVIGSDTMTADCRAIEPTLTSNINGTNVFTFKMYYSYVDRVTGIVYDNPFISLLVNEARIKVYWPQSNISQVWYDLVIKKCVEDSSGKSITYTCDDLYINELSKTGFQLTFDNELENNQGTVEELAARVVDGTEWRVIGTEGYVLDIDEDNNVINTTETVSEVGRSETVQQTIDEPMYEVSLVNKFTAENQSQNISKAIIPANSLILLPYSQMPLESDFSSDQTSVREVQFLYAKEYTTDANTLMVNNADCYMAKGLWKRTAEKSGEEKNLYSLYSSSTATTYYFRLNKNALVSSNYKGKCLKKTQKSIYDPLTKRYCDVFTNKNNETIYRFTSTMYDDVNTVSNLIINSSNFASISGWTPVKNEIHTIVDPPFTENTELISYDPSVFMNIGNQTVYNAALQNSGNYLTDGLPSGTQLIFRYKACEGTTAKPDQTKLITSYKNSAGTIYFQPYISVYTKKDEIYERSTKTDENYISVIKTEYKKPWVQVTIKITKTITRNQLYTDKIGFFIKSNFTTNWLEEVQLFQKISDDTTNGFLEPNSVQSKDIVDIYYYYYNKTKSANLKDANDIDYLYKGTTDTPGISGLTPVYNNNFCKIRAINESHTNRFNLIQTLAETFQCWAKFIILHDNSTGKIKYKNNKPQKFIIFAETIGIDNGVVFRYGTDLQTIERTNDSNEIVTKTCVPQNENEFGNKGYCTISRSPENYIREEFILNFDYYITHNILDGDQLNRDLYVPTIGYRQITSSALNTLVSKQKKASDITRYKFYTKPSNYIEFTGLFKSNTTYYIYKTDYADGYSSDENLGYCYWLNKYNIIYQDLLPAYENLENQKTNLEATEKILNEQITAIDDLIKTKKDEAMQLAGVTRYEKKNSTDKACVEYKLTQPKHDEKLDIYQNEITIQTKQLAATKSDLKNLQTTLKNVNKQITSNESNKKFYLNKIKKLHTNFFTKYGNYIQEGSWTSEEYSDDTLYYMDALDVAYTSSRPRAEYSINVIRLNALEEYKAKTFQVGDICYIEDTEFFGYKDSKKQTPYREMILVSEITSHFDNPTQDQIVVQNYKTQFEDLFQRITATTNSLQYASGAYAKAAAAVTSEGTITEEVLQDSITRNNKLIISAQNESVYWDSTGLTVMDLTNSSKRTRITSGGIFITNNGGASWKSAIRGDGISTEYLTAGSINANVINIFDGDNKSFRWDNTGINAYNQTASGIDLGNFVRFDHYGIYGLNKGTDIFKPETEEEVWNNADFALTWKGFLLRSTSNDGSFEITSDNDLSVYKKGVERIKIGLLNNALDLYGIRINDKLGNQVISTGSDGDLYISNTLYINNKNFQTRIGYFKDNAGYKPVVLDIYQFLGYTLSKSEVADPTTTYYKKILLADVTTDILADSNKIYYTFNSEGYNEIYYVHQGDNPKAKGLREIQFVSVLPYRACAVGEEVDKNKAYYKKNTNNVFYLVDTPKSGTLLTGYYTLDNPLINEWYEYHPNKTQYYFYTIVSEETEEKEYIQCTNYSFFESDYDEETKKYLPNSTSYNILNKSYQVFNANNKFIIYEDGSIYALDGYFRGNIYATDIFAENGIFNGEIHAFSGTFERPVKGIEDEGEQMEVYARLQDGLSIFKDSSLGLYNRDNIYNNDDNYEIFNQNDEHILTVEDFNNDKTSYYIVTIKVDEEGNLYNSYEQCTEETIYDRNTKYGRPNFPNFYLDSEGNINFVSGTFSGTLTGANGDFSGKITANEGEIGGFIIKEGRLCSVNGYQYADETEGIEESEENCTIKLNGNDGTVYAKNLTLGIGAVIEDYIQLGNAYLYNPALHSNQVLKSKNITIYDTGDMQIGDIIINGDKSCIYGDSFSITPNISTFNNVNVTGTLRTVIFEKDKVSAAGGAMLYKDAYEIREYQHNHSFLMPDGTEKLYDIVTLSNGTIINDDGTSSYQRLSYDDINNLFGHYVYVIDSNGIQHCGIAIQPEEGWTPAEDCANNSQLILEPLNLYYKVKLEDSEEEIEVIDNGILPLVNLINIGIDEDLIIGVNSSKGANNVLRGEGFSFVKINNYDKEKKQLNTSLSMYLGNLENIITDIGGSITGYGLYADNVYLQGQLAVFAPTEEGFISAGINSNTGIPSSMNKLGNIDQSPIIMWGGAISTTTDKYDLEAIADAKFQVTQNGSIYATNGKFEDNVITKGTVSGATIYATDIFGGEDINTLDTLNIYNTGNNIVFKQSQYYNHSLIVPFGEENERIYELVYEFNETTHDETTLVLNFNVVNNDGSDTAMTEYGYEINLSIKDLTGTVTNIFYDKLESELERIPGAIYYRENRKFATPDINYELLAILKIKDKNDIWHKEEYSCSLKEILPVEIFTIHNNYLSNNNRSFLNFTNQQITFYGDFIKTFSIGDTNIALNGTAINGEYSNKFINRINFSDTRSIQFQQKDNNDEFITLGEFDSIENFNLYINQQNINNNIRYEYIKDDNGKTAGSDLYVTIPTSE